MANRQVVIEIVKASRMFLVESGSQPGEYQTVDLARATCSCLNWQHRVRHSDGRCKHQEAAVAYEQERERLQALMPITTARAVERVTGERPTPRVPLMTDSEARAIFS